MTASDSAWETAVARGAPPAGESLESLEALARTSLRSIERRRFELLGLTIFVLVAFSVGILVLAFGGDVAAAIGPEFETTMSVLQIAIVPLSVGFAVYLIEKERQMRKTSRTIYQWELQATDRLRHLNEMKDSLLTAISHEVRTPLTKALGFAELLEQQGGRLDGERRADITARLASSMRDVDRLLADLIDIDRLGRGVLRLSRRPVDVGELVQGVVDTSGIADERPVKLQLRSVVVSIDAAKTERIVENLLSNVDRHTPSGTAVWIRVEPAAADGTYDAKSPEGVFIAVEDEGPGVPEELRTVIFRPFRQGTMVRTYSPGVGVGLSLVERFAELHGGRAWVQDSPGGGASFRVFLPSPEPVAAGAEPVSPQ